LDESFGFFGTGTLPFMHPAPGTGFLSFLSFAVDVGSFKSEFGFRIFTLNRFVHDGRIVISDL